MKRRVLFILSEDPRHGGRTAEAVRIAAGLRAWKKIDVRLYLRGDAVYALREDTWDFVDEEIVTRYLPELVRANDVVFLEGGAAAARNISPAPQLRELTPEEFSAMAAECHATSLF